MILLSNCCYHLRIKMNFTLNPVLQEQLPRLAKKISTINPEDIPENLLECLEQNNHTRILEELLQLFSQEFQKYIQGAFTQDWPFLPPTINPTMMVESNPKIPKLNQVELLLLCLNSAFNNEDYRMALSIAFVIDRFVYYCDGSAALLKIVDCIRKLSPSTPVAPQLIIRSARVMKDNGDLHGSIQILNRLIEEKWEDLPNCNDPARWQYKEEEQYINVAAVCVQIKGQIYHNLSLWKEAIGPLMQSIEGFNRLSVKDYKGISYTYSLLSRCLCRLSKTEYRNLRQEYSFQFENHCYQAYEFGMLAYDYCPGQRLFLSKHLLLSGECLLMYAVQLPDETLRYEMFFKILEILNLVFYKQNLEELSQSKDQLFNFIKSLFVTCLTLGCSANHFDRYMGNYLEAICLFVYKKFCDIGANQLDSEIGKQNLKQIIPALTFALITISQQYPNRSGSRGNNGFTAANMLNKTGDHVHASIDSTMNKTENVDPGKNVRMDQFNRNPIVADNAERIIGVKPDTSSNMSNARWMHVTIGAAERLQNLRRRTLEMGNRIMDDLMDSEKLGMEAENDPVVDVELATQIRGKIAKQKTKNNDEKGDNQEGSVKQEKGSRMLDYDAVTPERVVMVKEVPVEDCEAVTRDKMVMREEETPRVDSEAINQENVDINREGNQIVNHEVVNREKMVVQKGTPMVDCDAVTQKRLVKEIPMRDCDTVTQDEGVMQEGTPMVDCDAVTQKREAKEIPMRDCDAVTQDKGVMQEGTPMVDCDAVTQKRLVKEIPTTDCDMVTQDKEVMQEGTPMVDCDAVTQKREAKVIPMRDCDAVTQDKGVMQEGTPMVDCDAVTQKRLVKEIPTTDCDMVTQDKEVMQEGTPMVDCDAVTQKREAKEIPMRDCDAVTQDKGVMQEGTPMVDCDAVTQKRLVKEIPTTDCDMVTQDKEVMQEGTPMLDCDAVTQKREAKEIPMRDCDAVTQDKEVMQKGTPMVDCDAVTQKREAKEIPTTDCDMVTQNKEVMQEGTPMVDCDSVTQKMETKEIPMRDCDAVTQDKVVMQERTLMVDCVAGTQERTPMTDCEAVTQERMVTQTRKIPLVDCKAVTQERVVMQTERVVMQTEEAPIIDSEEVSQEGSARFDPLFARIDCIADTQERVYDTYVSFNVFSDLDNMGYSFPEEFWTLSIKPQRIVGLPSRISMIESKVSALDSLCQTFEDFNVDYDSSLTPRSKDASLVNTKALTLICQSKKDGTYLPNRLLTKFQRQESLPWEQQLNNPVTESMKQVSLTSFLGDLLKQNHEIISSLHSKTDSRKEDLNDQHESINKVQKATLYEYNPVTCVWSGQDTIVCTGKELTLGKGKKGQFRNVYQINYLHQEEPLGKYVSKRYRNQRESLQYMDDVVCQMQAGLYVNLFNQALKMFELDLRIYFLNAAFMLLYNSQGEVEDWMNIEPFVDGEFIKLTSNYDFCDPRGKNVSTSFTHFTYVQSGYQMMVCDLQGWLPSGTQNLIYLTDPQFHTDSGDSSPFDFGQEGIKLFFDVVHPECNEICQILKLQRPTF